MKKLVLSLIMLVSLASTAQTNTELQKHFEKFYAQMKKQGDIQGVINALTHLEVMTPSQARRDTLAYIYVSEGRNLEALNTIGIDKNANDSDINTEVKAIALTALNELPKALEFYEVLFQRKPNPYLAYEIADLKLQTNDVAGAKEKIEYGLANVTNDMKRSYYETQQPYQVSLKAGLTYLKALMLFNEDQTNNVEKAIVTLTHALAMDPNFNMAKITKDALLNKKKE